MDDYDLMQEEMEQVELEQQQLLQQQQVHQGLTPEHGGGGGGGGAGAGGGGGGGGGQEEEEEEEAYMEQAIEQQLADLLAKFTLPEQQQDPLQQLRLAYGYLEPGFSPIAAHVTYEESCSLAIELKEWAHGRGDPEVIVQVDHLVVCIRESYSALVALICWTRPEILPPMSAEDAIKRYVDTDGAKELPVQVVVKYILVKTHDMRLRHRDNTVFVQQFTDQGLPTHAWVAAEEVAGRDISTLEKMVAFVCTKAHNSAIWNTWLVVNTKAVVDKLKICLEPEFPVLRTSRDWISFSDGLYCVAQDLFVPYGQERRFGVRADLAACAYHRTNFAPAFFRVPGQPGLPLHPLVEVKTPIFDTIVDTQRLCGHTRFWLLALLGRCLYFSNVLEGWQVVPMLKGRAGSGKSTLVQFVTRIYQPTDTMIISNDSQAGFGLQQLTPDLFLWAVPELKTDFAVDQAQFQSLVSNERMSIARKYLDAFDGIIRAHGIMAGNTLPLRWQDNAGSICRRIIIFHFNFTPPRSDDGLLDRLCTVELPHLLRKMNWCYRHAATLLNGRNLWQSGFLSAHIVDQNKAMYRSMNVLMAYLSGQDLIRHPAAWVPLKHFQDCFNKYCQDNTTPKCQWNDEFYGVPFKDSGVTVRTGNYVWDDGPRLHGVVLMGICPQEDRARMTIVNNGDNPELEDPTEDAVDHLAVQRHEPDYFEMH